MANDSIIPPGAESPFKGVSRTPYLVAALITYILICSLLRFQRRDAMRTKFNYPDRQSLSRMTNTDAQAIMGYLSELEFPKIFQSSIQFAVFKTYGIPTISQLLVDTKQFSTPENASKRYADTVILISEFSAHHPRAERALKAISRMNYIHSRYQKAGKISNDDLLYSLSVFITEPISWIAKYEWREMSDMEVCAQGTFWKSIGDAMGIDYSYLGHSTWTDGIEFYEDIKAWAESYEEKYMVPALPNKQTADELVPLLLFHVPDWFRDSATDITGVLMGDRLRKSMMFSAPHKSSFILAKFIFAIRRFILRYCSLPRPSFMRVREVGGDPDPKTGRYYASNYQVHPFYNKPGFLNRWGPAAWLVRLSGGFVPGSKEFIPEGYSIEEVGPSNVKGKGQKEMDMLEEKLQDQRPAGCPFAFAR